jgi:hypothetical protein
MPLPINREHLAQCIAGDTGTQRARIRRLQAHGNADVMTKRSARRRCAPVVRLRYSSNRRGFIESQARGVLRLIATRALKVQLTSNSTKTGRTV